MDRNKSDAKMIFETSDKTPDNSLFSESKFGCKKKVNALLYQLINKYENIYTQSALMGAE